MTPASTTAIADRFRALAEDSDEVIVEVGPDTTLTYVSPNVHTVFAIDAAELTGLDLETIATRFDVSPREELHGFSGLLSLAQLIGRGPYQRIRRLQLPDGSVRWVDIAVTGFEAGNGQSHATAVVRDITQRMQLEEQLVRAQKLESLSLLAGGSAHSFNNQLTTILLNVELAIAEVEEGKSQKILPYLWSVVEAAARAEETTHQLLTYAGKQPIDLNTLDVTEEIRSLRGFLRSMAAGRVTLEFNLRGWLPAVEADSKQLNQLITHLTLNAVEACAGDGGRVIVSTGTFELDEHSPDAIRTGLAPGTYVCIEVSDNGEGIDPEAQLKVFDPFYSTRPGSIGLGLAEAQGIARAHHGTIIVDSHPEDGATFKVLLPVAEQTVPDAAPIRGVPATAPDSPVDLVLVVDDEDYIRQLAAAGLQRAGYDVITAGSGPEAIAQFAEHADRISLLITDLSMPEMSGEALIGKLRRTHPDLPVLMMSGYSRSSVSRSLVDLPTISFLQKPFLISELTACVSRIFQQADAEAPRR